MSLLQVRLLYPSTTIHIEIADPNFHKEWYSLNGGDNVTFTKEIQIGQTEWNKVGNGTVLITFYANDIVGNKDFIENLIQKDAYGPVIIIHSPYPDQWFKITSPIFNLSIIEKSTTDNWYMIF
ncbi:MAG: hypothetical protein ACFFG0_55685 [Candidatus Thorarchaeota archaeon]